ncbi:MAG: RNA degradosome polyphosphate kinase [Rhodobacteraceae bacterium]|nr:RNA degradosome polyphosphate kinase [Paracoccaceae bacterium]
MDADFLNNPVDTVCDCPTIDITDPKRFFNREMSWLSFNWRVLEESENPKVPLLERVRFLAISATNLDEFYTVRVAGLRQLLREGVAKLSNDGQTAAQQVEAINIDAHALMLRQQISWRKLRQELAAEKIRILSAADVSDDDRRVLEKVFLEQVFPILTPIAIDPAHPFPFIASGGFALALQMKRKGDKPKLEALLPVPAQIPRFHRMADLPDGTIRFLPLESLLEIFFTQLFPGYKLQGNCAFRVLRDSDLEVEDEAEDLVREFETALKRRKRGQVIRLKISGNAPDGLRQTILQETGVMLDEVIEVDGLIGMTDLSELVIKDRPDLLWKPFSPRVPERVLDFDGDIFAAIKQKDMLLHHPYETFDTVVQFLKQAAADPNVLAIKQTLYRTSRDSPIVAALCEAAEAGKSVTAIVELKARFDEAANIRLSRSLERAGAQVVYGFIDWKTHAKISTVVRREGEKLVTYTHFGTGNYHPITANIYTDLSLFTCDKALGRDATKVFNYVSGYARPEVLENLSISPLTLKNTLLGNIEAEAEFAKTGKPAAIWVKLNSLVEVDVIDALYRASAAGVKIDLVIRGICGLRPGVPGLSENIRVKSVVGRFLEHSRICCFGNGYGLPSSKALVYISSADWMGRNLAWRIETLVQITNKTVHAQIIDQVMAANLADQAQSWVLQSDGGYIRHDAGEKAFSCHRFFMENPSLSGRGRVGAKDAPRLTHSHD